MTDRVDRLYDLMPAVYRLRDAEQGYPLQGLLRVIAEQVNVVEDDIAQLYENWFIETCEDWVVPYIGSLVGYQPAYEIGEPVNPASPRAETRERILIPRQEVAREIGYRRRKGTLHLLESLAVAVAGWPARAVEFYRLLGVTQNVSYPHLKRGRTVDVRNGRAVLDLDGPFDQLAHTVDVRRVNSSKFPGKYNIPEVGVFVWRLKSYRVANTPAYCYEEEGPNCFLFGVLGHDTPLFTKPASEVTCNPTKLDLPIPISRREFEKIQLVGSTREASGIPEYYGDGKSIQISVGPSRTPVPADQIVATDLTDWTYRPQGNQCAVDPELGRIAFAPGAHRPQGIWVSYSYGFSADMGGGPYPRVLSETPRSTLYPVGEGKKNATLADALAKWRADGPQDAVIEIRDNGVYVEPIRIQLKKAQTLQIRAASGVRPILRLLDWQTSLPDDLSVAGEAGSRFILDGLVATGRGVNLDGNLSSVTFRHCTLVPGWSLHCDCEPKRPTEPSIEVNGDIGCLTIEHSIVGGIQVNRDEAATDPLILRISDSIVDATSTTRVALGAPEHLCAHTNLTICRCTVFGEIQTETIELAENSILMGALRVCRRQVGCIRFCYVTPGSRTPSRYECQPDMVESAVAALFRSGDITAEERDALVLSERLRVEPEFNSVRYGSPTYCQLADECALEITGGADDESEMGAFHDLYQPQRAANLRARLAQFTPAGMDAGIIFAS